MDNFFNENNNFSSDNAKGITELEEYINTVRQQVAEEFRNIEKIEDPSEKDGALEELSNRIDILQDENPDFFNDQDGISLVLEAVSNENIAKSEESISIVRQQIAKELRNIEKIENLSERDIALEKLSNRIDVLQDENSDFFSDQERINFTLTELFCRIDVMRNKDQVSEQVSNKDTLESQKDNLDPSGTIEESKTKKEAKKEKQGIEIEKQYFEKLSSSLKKLVYVLRERENKNLNKLLQREDTDRIVISVNAIEDILSKEKSDINSLETRMINIISVIENIGSVRNGRAIRENTENLRMIGLNLNQIEEGSQYFRDNLLKITRKDSLGAEKTIGLLNRLLDISKEKRFYITKLANTLEKYERGY